LNEIWGLFNEVLIKQLRWFAKDKYSFLLITKQGYVNNGEEINWTLTLPIIEITLLK
jgi:hypothetical protein